MKILNSILVFLVCFVYANFDETKKIEMEIAKVYMDAYPAISVVGVSAASTIMSKEPEFIFTSIDKASINPLRDRGQVVVIFQDAQNNQRKKIYRYTIDASIEASRARTIIAKDQQILPENIEPTFLKIGSFADMPLPPSQIINSHSKRFIPKGTVIMQKDIGELAEVRKGQAITIVYKSGAIEADMEAVALEDAQIGQMISVKTKAGKVLRVRVSGKNMADID